MIEGALLLGGLGLGLVLLGGRRKRRRAAPPPPPIVVNDPPPPVVEPQRNVVSRHQKIAELMEKWCSSKPKFGRLVQVRVGQSIEQMVHEAFDEVGKSTAAQREHYIHCMSSSNYNAETYGTPSTSKRFGTELLAPGSGLGLRVAFLPRNEDAYHAMSVGRMPKMTVDPKTGEPRTSDRALGMVWMPPVWEEGVHRGELPTCAPYSYENGDSTINPPPSLLSLLEES